MPLLKHRGYKGRGAPFFIDNDPTAFLGVGGVRRTKVAAIGRSGCIFVHDFRLESSSVIIGVTGLSVWEAHLFNIVVVYFCYPCKNSGVTPYFVRRVGST